MLFRDVYTGGTIKKRRDYKNARELLSQKAGAVTSRGKGGRCHLRGAYRGAGNVLFFNLSDSYVCSHYNYLLNYRHNLCSFLYVCYMSPKNVTKSE